VSGSEVLSFNGGVPYPGSLCGSKGQPREDSFVILYEYDTFLAWDKYRGLRV